MQELLISERPAGAHYSGNGGGSGAGGGRDEQFRGVMLSARPQMDHARKFAVGQVAIPFVPGGVVHGQLGLPPPQESAQENGIAREELKSHKKTKSIHMRHRKYLKELAALKDLERMQALEEAHRQEEQASQLKETQAAIRQGIARGDPGVIEVLQKKMPASAVLKPAEYSSSVAAIRNAKSSTDNKPAWAMTAKEAEEMDDEELEDLVEFAKGLDYDKFIADLEVREALNAIHKRVDELAPEEKEAAEKAVKQVEGFEDFDDFESYYEALSDEEELLDEETKANIVEGELREDGTRGPRMIRRVRRRARKPAALTEGVPEGAEADADRVKQELAQQVLQSSTTMRQVHSKASVASIVDAVAKKETLKEVTSSEPTALHQLKMRGGHFLEREREELAKKEPVIVTHAEKETMVRSRRDPNQVQNLPYLYRCPAI